MDLEDVLGYLICFWGNYIYRNIILGIVDISDEIILKNLNFVWLFFKFMRSMKFLSMLMFCIIFYMYEMMKIFWF